MRADVNSNKEEATGTLSHLDEAINGQGTNIISITFFLSPDIFVVLETDGELGDEADGTKVGTGLGKT